MNMLFSYYMNMFTNAIVGGVEYAEANKRQAEIERAIKESIDKQKSLGEFEGSRYQSTTNIYNIYAGLILLLFLIIIIFVIIKKK